MDMAKLRLRIERLRRRMYGAKTEIRQLKISQELDKLILEYQRGGGAA